MTDLFFEKPILNSPYAYPIRHWELDGQGQPTQQIIEKRRRADLITPIPKPRRRSAKDADVGQQQALVFDEGKGLSTQAQQDGPTALAPWPGTYVCAEGRYREGDAASAAGKEKRAAIFIGPEFGTVSRPDLVAAAREAADAEFDVLITCAFNYDAHSAEFAKLGRLPVLKARMNADLHLAEDLKTTDNANLPVIFGEPDIEVLPTAGGQLTLKLNGVDVFHPSLGEVRSSKDTGEIACWFIDTEY
jgi:hypothetical protein